MGLQEIMQPHWTSTSHQKWNRSHKNDKCSKFLYSSCRLLLSRWVLSHSLWPHGLQHTRLPCPSLSPGVFQTHVPSVSNALQSKHLILWLPLLLPPSVFPSIRVFSNESAHSTYLRWCIWRTQPRAWHTTDAQQMSTFPQVVKVERGVLSRQRSMCKSPGMR